MKNFFLFLLLWPILIFGQNNSCDLDFGSEGLSNSLVNIADVLPFAEGDVVGVFYQGSEGLISAGSSTYSGNSNFEIGIGNNNGGPNVGEQLIYILWSGGVLYNLNIITYNVDDPNTYVDNIYTEITDIEVADFTYGIEQATINNGNSLIETCLDDTDLYTQLADSYLWSTGATTQSITVSDSGTYTVTTTNQYGCQSIAQVEVDFIASNKSLSLG